MGYLSEVSPLELSKDKTRKYFNFTVQDDDNMYCGVCFSAEKCSMFSEIANDNTSNSIEIKHFQSSDINDDIIVNFTSIKKTERKTFQVKPYTVQQINNECKYITWLM